MLEKNFEKFCKSLSDRQINLENKINLQEKKFEAKVTEKIDKKDFESKIEQLQNTFDKKIQLKVDNSEFSTKSEQFRKSLESKLESKIEKKEIIAEIEVIKKNVESKAEKTELKLKADVWQLDLKANLTDVQFYELGDILCPYKEKDSSWMG